MSDPLISVVMPAYNHERFVGAAVDSVLAQSLGDLELVIIDDGSTDSTAEVIRQRHDPRLRYHHQANADAYNALNAGIARARGEWVAILNSDDCYHPDRLRDLLEFCRETKSVCAFTNVRPIDEAGTPIPEGAHFWHTWHARNRAFFFEHRDLYAAFLRGNLMVTTSNLFMRAEAARRVGPFAALRYLHDYDFIFRMMVAHADGVRYLDDRILLDYRIHGSNTLKQGAIKARLEDQQVIRTYMLALVPDAARRRVETGVNRLVELEAELQQVRAGLRWGRLKPVADWVGRRIKR